MTFFRGDVADLPLKNAYKSAVFPLSRVAGQPCTHAAPRHRTYHRALLYWSEMALKTAFSRVKPVVPVRPVFVYGTLRQGGSNDITRLLPQPVWIGYAKVRGTLYDLGHYPGLVLGDAGEVCGEVYAIEPALEEVLDRIEEIAPQPSGEYRKRFVSIGLDDGNASPQCLLYELNPERAAGRPVIAHGDWLRHAERDN